MTKRQHEVFALVARATARGEWHRAEHPGQRVTLASLCRNGAIIRRARRGKDGDAHAAYEYQLAPRVVEMIWKEP